MNEEGKVTVDHQKSPREADIQIGMRMRRARNARAMSQEALADLLGLTFQQVQKYEKGTNRLSGSRMLDVCAKLGITPNELTGINGDGEHVEPLPQLSSNAMKFAQKYDRLDPTQKRSVAAVVNSMLGERNDH